LYAVCLFVVYIALNNGLPSVQMPTV